MFNSSQPDSLERTKPMSSGKPVARDLLLQEFDSLADAHDAVPKLRDLVLQLAVRGILVPQDPKDEPAKELARRVISVAKQVAKERELKLPAPEFSTTDQDKVFPLPNGWTWVKLGDLCIKLGAGSTPLGGKRVYQKAGVKFLRSQNVWDDGLRLDDVAFISPTVHQDMESTCVEPGDVLLNITGASIGRSALVPDDFDEANVSQHVSIIRLADKALRHFIHLCVTAPDFQSRIMQVQVGVSREGLSMARLKEFVVALPPLGEQRRIVAKVEELLALCDELEARQVATQERRARLVHSALDHLTAAKDEQDFRKQCSFILHNSSLILDSVPALRRAILSLAVRGRLVPQNQNDEPALALLSKVRKSRQRLAESVGKKPPKDWPKVEPDEMIFNLPDGWVATRLGNLAANIEAGSSPQCEGRPKTKNEWGVLKISAVSWDEFDPDENKALPANVEPRPEYEVQNGDFIMSRANTAELVAKSVVTINPPPRLLLNDKTLRVHFTEYTEKRFLNMVNNSAVSRAYYAKAASGTSSSMKNILEKVFRCYRLPFHPLRNSSGSLQRWMS